MAHLIAGTNPLDLVSRAIQNCAFCKGTGSNRGLRCFVCGGKGKLSVKNPPLECGGCLGLGTRDRGDIICSDCSGTGWRAASRV